jgi:GNAT superfamily N-acetyltransferase
MDFSQFNFVRLSQAHHILPFDCGDSDLNEFLLKDSGSYLNQLLAVTYLIEYNGRTIAFFSVSNDKITVHDVDSNNQFKKIFQRIMPQGKRYRCYPAVKIGRLGIDASAQNRGLGTKLLDYIKGMFITNNRTGCQYITVDAYKQSLRFYEKNGFRYFTDKDKNSDTRQMFYCLLELVNPADVINPIAS